MTKIEIISLALTLVFIHLKLSKQIGWHWVWVLCPFWGAIVLGVFFVMVVSALR